MDYSYKCCVVIPLYKSELLHSEIAVFYRCLHELSEYSKYIVVPCSLRSTLELVVNTEFNHMASFDFVSVPDSCLTSIDSYNQLMLEPWFYKIFDKWEYILVHQLDAMIIDGSRLSSLLLMNYSYVGGCFVIPSRLTLFNIRFWRIYGGNGGLSLRRTSDIISLLESADFIRKPIRSFRECLSYLLMKTSSTYSGKRMSVIDCLSILVMSLLMSFGYKNSLSTMDSTRTCQEDYLFSVYAPRYFKWFRVPSPYITSQFFVDTYPEVIFKRYNPDSLLGCHGWEKNNLSFWKRNYPNIFHSDL